MKTHLWQIDDREVLYAQSNTYTIYADTQTDDVFTSNGSTPTAGEYFAILEALAVWKQNNHGVTL